MWKASASVVGERPVLGTGPDTFHLAAQPYLSERLFSLEPVTGILTAPPDPHSAPITIAVSFGVLGLLVFVAIALVWARELLGRREGEAPDRRVFRLCAGAGVAGFFAALLFVPWAAILGGFPLLVAGLAIADPEPVSQKRTPLLARILAGAIAAVLVVLSVMLVVGIAALDRATESESAKEAVSANARVARMLPTYPYPRFAALHAEGSSLGGSAAGLASWRSRVEGDPEVLGDATYALQFVRDGLDQAYRWSRSDVAWEATLLARAAERFPASPDVRLEQAHLALIEGDDLTAARILQDLDYLQGFDTRVDLYRYYLAVSQQDEGEAARLRRELEPEYGPLQLLAPQ